jgi:plastocyanin
VNTTERRPVKRSLILLSLVLGLALAGCGGDDETTSPTEAATTEAATTEETTTEETTTEETTTEETTTSGGGGTLNGSVGPGFEISVEGDSSLSAGAYTLVVDDKSASHNFHLTGPGGVDVSTSVEAEGEQSFEVELAPGEYTFVCDPHASQMRGTFTVG